MSGAADDQALAVRGRRIAHGPGGGIGRDVHAAGDVAGHPVGHAVGPLRLQPREEPAAVEDRNTGGEHTLLGLDGELVGLGRAHVQRQLVAFARNLLHANALREAAAALFELDDQAVQQRHRIELGLLGEPDAAVERERDVGFVDPFRLQPGGLARLEFGPSPTEHPFGLRVGEGVLALHRDAVRLAVPRSATPGPRDCLRHTAGRVWGRACR